jgi:hypothetical protein
MAKKKVTKKEEPIVDLTAPASPDEQTLPSAGLGDTIKSITNALGIETCTKCEERRKNLNKMFPWLRAKEMEPLAGEDLELMIRVRKTPQAVENDDVDALFKLYNKIYSPQRPIKRCQCPGLLRTVVERLELLMNQD